MGWRAAAADLPVLDVVDEAVTAALASRRLVLEAPAGAGKTTVLPLALADALGGGRVVVLEPRRVAARAAARRMAAMVGDRLGGHVGVTTRDDRRTSSATRVEVVTEGVLVNRLQRDPALDGVVAVVVDEFHERSLQADLSLAFALETARVLREDLVVVVMSATLDGARVAALLDDAPVVTSDGRLHPVDVVHRERSSADPLEPDVAAAVLDALDDHPGDVLVFLPGVRELQRTAAELAGRVAGDVDVLLLHGGLPPAEQDRAVGPAPPGRRHVVLSTDLAESSLTVPGVRVVVDAGLAREPRFDAGSGTSRLTTGRASLDRATQRAGRAGRVAPGVAVRLWARRDEGMLPVRRSPAIAHEDLSGFVLEVARWGASDPAELPLLDPPPPAAWDAATTLLRRLGVLDADGRVTDHGREVARLPLLPRSAHLVVAADPEDRALAVDLAALLADRDVLSGAGTADLAERVRALRGRPHRGGRVRDGALARAGRDADRIARAVGAQRGRGDPRPGDVGRVLLRAYPDRVGVRRPDGGHLLAAGRPVRVRDGDPLAAADLLVVPDLDGGREEGRVHLAATVDRADLDRVLGHLLEAVDHVAWDRSRGEVVTERRTELLGLVLSRGHLDRPDDAATTAALLDALRDRGTELLPWSGAATALRGRAALLHEHLGAPWPAMDEAALLEDLEDWLAPWLSGLHRVAHLDRVPLVDALRQRVGWDRARRIDELLPTHVDVPSGRRARLRYDPDLGPVLSVKLQELFGLDATPTVADGALPVTVELLTPAGRPAAVTSDLAGFWRGAYHDVRAELRGRYPKHPWPEDPTTARATGRTKRRA